MPDLTPPHVEQQRLQCYLFCSTMWMMNMVESAIDASAAAAAAGGGGGQNTSRSSTTSQQSTNQQELVEEQVLRGRIYYRSDLPLPTTPDDCCGDNDNSNDRTGKAVVAASSSSLPSSSSGGGGRKRRRPTMDNTTTPSSLTDLIFVPENNDKNYLLSLPRSMTELAQDAARTVQTVEIIKYTIVEVTLKQQKQHQQQQKTTKTKKRRQNQESGGPIPVPYLDGRQTHDMIEVHRNGIRVCPPPDRKAIGDCDARNNDDKKNDSGGNKNESDDNDLWTLTQFWRKELVDEQLERLELQSESSNNNENEDGGTSTKKPKMKKKKAKSSSSKKERFNIIASVEAISPVIVWNTTNPDQHFALVELYDDDDGDGDNDPTTMVGRRIHSKAVLVLKGTNALKWHSSLIPSPSSSSSDSSLLQNENNPQTTNHDYDGDDDNDNDETNRNHSADSSELNDMVIIRDVICTRWRVPEELFGERNDNNDDGNNDNFSHFHNHLKGQVPSKVFVATSSFSVERYNGNRNIIQNRSTLGVRRNVLKSVPTSIGATNPHLVHLRGKLVRNAETAVVSSKTEAASMIHFIDIMEVDGCQRTNSKRVHRIFLTHHPLSTAMQWSLREGAIVEALNVHLICGSKIYESSGHSQSSQPSNDEEMLVYGACLRSSIVLIAMAGELAAETSNQEQEKPKPKGKISQSISSSPPTRNVWPETQELFHSMLGWSNSSSPSSSGKRCRPVVQLCTETWLPYTFWKIRKTYLQYHVHEKVDSWIEENFSNRPVSSSKKTQIVQYLVDSGRRNRSPVHQNCRFPSRDPYAEFFDHSCSEDEYGEYSGELNTSRRQVNCGCRVSMINRDFRGDASRCQALVGLSQISDASQDFVISRIRAMLSVSMSSKDYEEIQSGWHGSVSATANEILTKDIERDNGRTSHPVFIVGGYVGECRTCPSNGVASIYDSKFQFPVCFSDGDEQASIDSFVLGSVGRVSISCYCLGSRNADDEAAGSRQVNLPSFSSADNGGCSVVEVEGFVFVTAIYMECQSAQVISSTKKNKRDDELFGPDTITVDECLQSSPNFLQSQHDKTKVNGILIRNCIKVPSSKSGLTSCHLSISTSPLFGGSWGMNGNSFNDSCLQSMNMVVSLEHNTARLIAFKKVLDTYWQNVDISEKRRNSASCFWAMGSSGLTCPLLLGGYEEENQWNTKGLASFTTIFAPMNSLRLGKGGSFRLECSVRQLESIRLSVRQQHQTVLETNLDPFNIPYFDFVAGKKFLTGMLQRRIGRRNIFEREGNNFRVVGEMPMAQTSSAIPAYTLSDLTQSLCMELRDSSSCALRPSLTRRLTQCRFLGISYCEVRCACMKCFRALIVPASELRNRRKKMIDDGAEEMSFWHLPPPLISSLEQHRTIAAPTSDDENANVPDHIRRSSLSCPNKCPKKHFGVKWECSGVLDDGTGQAQLYTERETALTLLGMSAKHIEWVEHGVWFTDTGVLKVQKTMTPSKEIRDTVRNLRRNPSVVDPIKVLPPRLRAEYLLEYYCRSSTRPRRPLDYYVRCKPLDKKFHVEHGTVESFFGNGSTAVDHFTTLYRGETSTYKLPRLNLQLVDCGLPSSEYDII